MYQVTPMTLVESISWSLSHKYKQVRKPFQTFFYHLFSKKTTT